MRPHFSFYDSELGTLIRRYKYYKRITEADKKTAELTDILSKVKAINKDNCSEDKKISFAFEVEEFQLHILYTAFNSKTLPKEHEISLDELTKKYQDLVHSPGYQNLKPCEGKKKKIDRYLANLTSKLEQSQKLSLSR